jgi:hypothetical protein
MLRFHCFTVASLCNLNTLQERRFDVYPPSPKKSLKSSSTKC